MFQVDRRYRPASEVRPRLELRCVQVLIDYGLMLISAVADCRNIMIGSHRNAAGSGWSTKHFMLKHVQNVPVLSSGSDPVS